MNSTNKTVSHSNTDYYFALEALLDSARSMRIVAMTGMALLACMTATYTLLFREYLTVYASIAGLFLLLCLYIMIEKGSFKLPKTHTSVFEYPEYEVKKIYEHLPWYQRYGVLITMTIAFLVGISLASVSQWTDNTIEGYLLILFIIPVVLTMPIRHFIIGVLIASCVQIAVIAKIQYNLSVVTSHINTIAASTVLAIIINRFLHQKKLAKFNAEYSAFRQRQELTQSLSIIETQRGVMEQSNEYLIETNQSIAIKNQQLRELNDRLGESNEELSELNRRQERIMAIVAHDLKSPLTGIQLGVEVLKIYARKSVGDAVQSDQEQKQDKILSQTANAIERMQKIIGLLLEHKESKERLNNLQMQSAPIMRYVQETLAEYEPRAAKKEQKILCANDFQGQCWCDEFLFRQVLDNVVSNAVKYSYPATMISITLTEEEHALALAVADQGQGIPVEEMNQLFQPFRKLSSRPTAGEDSTGLGLSIAKEYMEAMGGSIHANHNTDGQGMVFTLRLKKA